jgi:hypothetical protein
MLTPPTVKRTGINQRKGIATVIWITGSIRISRLLDLSPNLSLRGWQSLRDHRELARHRGMARDARREEAERLERSVCDLCAMASLAQTCDARADEMIEVSESTA